MSPETHLLGSWLIAAKTTNNLRDCRLVTLAGFVPDLDGLGLMVDAISGRTMLYHQYHHMLFHGAFGALLVAGCFALLARDKGRVFLWCLLVFHLHILCDLVGSRGPAPEDLWPIHYFGPFNREPVWLWTGQWALDAWPNRVIGVAVLALALWLPLKLGHSVVGVFNRKADDRFIAVLRKWRHEIRGRFVAPAHR
jgi:hypothetical protein